MIMNKIVVIDDDRKSIEKLELSIALDLANYKLMFFEYPEEFEEANIEDISLIILDIMFVGNGKHNGGINLGIEFYLKYKKKNPLTPIIFYTNTTEVNIEEDFMKIIKENGDLFIEKPSTLLNSLLSIIKKRLGL